VDVLVSSETMRNRALSGDIVAVVLEAQDSWELRRALGGRGYSSAASGGGRGKRGGGGAASDDEEDEMEAAAAALAAERATALAERAAKPHPIPAVARMYGDDEADDKEGETAEQRLWRPRYDVRTARARGDEDADAAATEADPAGADILLPSTIKGWTVPEPTAELRAALAAAVRGTMSGTRQPTGRVVSVVKRIHPMRFVGVLKPWSDGQVSVPASESHVRLEPLNNAEPWIRVPRTEAPPEFLADTRAFGRHLFAVKADASGWSDTSRFPNGHSLAPLGESGTITTDMEAILVKHNIDGSGFPDRVLAELSHLRPDDGSAGSGWSVPEEERASRRDLTGECVFTIDPTTAKVRHASRIAATVRRRSPPCHSPRALLPRPPAHPQDLDDALHIKPLGGGRYEVGVHIADVSHFVQPGTEVDGEARTRCTSTYLVRRVIPMLPPVLCEVLCSLNPNVERLAFSCIWVMNERGEMEPDEVRDAATAPAPPHAPAPPAPRA